MSSKVAGVLALIAFMTLLLGCDPLCTARGVLRTADGRSGVPCRVRMDFPSAPLDTPGSNCRQPGQGGSDQETTIPSGSDFSCQTTPGTALYEVRVRCPSYEPLVTQPFQLGDGHRCSDQDLGVLTVQPANRP